MGQRKKSTSHAHDICMMNIKYFSFYCRVLNLPSLNLPYTTASFDIADPASIQEGCDV